ncbi:MAG: TorF family putative porin [Sphingomonadales bacterium]
MRAGPLFEPRGPVAALAPCPDRSRRRAVKGRALHFYCIAGVVLASGIGLAAPARAQLAGSIAIESDYRLRGFSLSDGRPVATAQIAYDHSSGLYASAEGIVEFGRDEPFFLGVQGNIGYAKRLGPTLSMDLGLLRSQYRPSYYGGRAKHYTEAYAGLTFKQITGRIFLSPDYFRPGVTTLYGEIEGGLQPSPNWRLHAHLGTLIYLRTPDAGYYRDARYDWRVGASRQLGKFELHAALSGGGPSEHGSSARRGSGTVLTGGASLNF